MRGFSTCIVVAVLVLAPGPGCGGGGGGGGAEQPVDVSVTGRVVLGFLGEATVEVYDTRELTAPIASTTTSTGTTHDEVGHFEIPLAGVRPSDLLLLVVTGGSALDLDADGVLDPVATPNRGTIHGLASVAQLQAGPVLLSVVTEIAVERSRFHLAAGNDADYVGRALDAWARTLFARSTDADADVDRDDLIAFDPRADRDALLRTWPSFQTFREDLVGGSDVAATALALSDSQIHSEDLDGSTSDVDVQGDRAYVCRGSIGLQIYDVSDPAAPVLLGTYDSPGSAWQVQVVGELAYLTDFSGGLQIVDVSDAGLPVQAGAVPIDDAMHLQVVGDRAYVVESGTPRLHVVDVATPASAAVLGSEDLAATVYDLTVAAGHAYVRHTSSIEVVDVSTPSMPSSLGSTVTTGSYGRVLARGSLLYVAASDLLETFDLSTPAAPEALGTTPLPSAGSSPSGLVGLGDGRLAVALSFGGVSIVDVKSPRTPVCLGTLPVSGGAGALAVGDGILVATEVNGGLQVHASATPPPSAVVAALALSSPIAFDRVGGLGAVLVRESGVWRLRVVDLGDPERPSLRGAVDLTIASPRDVRLAGSFAYVSGSALDVVDLSNPDAPVLAGGLSSSGAVSSLALDTNVLYGPAGGDGLRLFDITTPTAPLLIDTLDTPGQARTAAYDGGVLVLADGFQGLRTYDATVPGAPVQKLTLPLSQAVDLATRSGLTFLARFGGTGNGALEVVDHDPPDAATGVASLPLRSNPEGVALVQDHAYLTARGVVEVVDLPTPLAPLHQATLGVPPDVGFMEPTAGDDHLFVLGRGGWLLVFRAAHRTVP